ncbi:MAG TPA: copper amine oxidase, partial [Syntrophomonas sp.]|nr:copper amine oxidase [Syntrophomonas sp.]
SNSYPVPANWDGGVQIVIDGQPLTIPSGYGQAYISKLDRVMLPLRAVGEALGCEVKWVSDTSTVLINAKTDEIENPVDDVDNSDNTPNLVDNQLLNDLAQFSTNLKLSDGSVINSSALANMDASNFSAEQLNNFRVYLDQLNKYPKVINLPSGETIRISDLSIMGPSILSAAQIQDWLDNEAPRI